MSPAVRLVTLLVVAGIAGTGRPLLVLYAAVITLLACSLQDPRVLKAAWRALVRLRWLLLSITVIYLWFTPGIPLVAAWGDSSPTREGVQAGLLHAGVLAVIALAASVTVNATARDALTGGLIWLLQPLSFLGVPTRSFALRLGLTLETVLAAPKSPKHRASQGQGQGQGQDEDMGTGNFITRAAAVGAERFLAAERNCMSQSDSIELPAIVAPPPGQWVVPGLLLGGAALIAAF